MHLPYIEFGSLALNAYKPSSSISQILGKYTPKISTHVKVEKKKEMKNLVLSARNPSPTPQFFWQTPAKHFKLH
jgi:hypothetical protein